ncbi:TlpA family protein disulfide reductase [Acetobacterium bakii]|uniref:Peroxiredoxin n=1 Tax=Acetobacterium bakii TaxID=52689 RepID=A0A0L6U489_9FIRM|nr:TlpA disulfide reductase family protein [Acetobacterium bakii]KNZ42615.1 peroxiredoxin [Acetobacterium bakii]
MNNKTKTIIGIMAFITFLVIASLGYSYLSSSFKTNNSSENNENPVQESSYDSAPDFTVVDETGNPVKLSDFSGKPIVLNFWASWCPPCKSEMPHFNSVYGDNKDAVVFLMLDLVDGQRETTEKGLAYVKDQGFDFPVYFDTEQEAARAYAVTSIPTTFFIDANGNIITSYRGAIDEATLMEGIALITN